MADRVIQRNDTAARWQSINPVLAQGELGIVSDEAKGYKIGDGVTAWNDLEYPANPTSVVQELGDSETAVISQKVTTSMLNSTRTQSFKATEFPIVWIDGKYVNYITGEISDNSEYSYTDHIIIPSFVKYIAVLSSCLNDDNAGLAFYTKGKEYISGEKILLSQVSNYLDITYIEVPENANSCRFTCITSLKDKSGIFNVDVNDSLSILNNNINSSVEGINSAIETKLTSAIKTTEFSELGYLGLDGSVNIQTSGNWYFCNNVEIPIGAKFITYTLYQLPATIGMICFYDNAHYFMSSISDDGTGVAKPVSGTVAIPEGACYVRVSCRIDYPHYFLMGYDFNTLEKLSQLTEDYLLIDSIAKPMTFSGADSIAFGDSIMKGYLPDGTISSNPWINIVSGELNFSNITNRAVDGAGFTLNSNSIMSQVNGQILNTRDFIFVAAGTNDYNYCARSSTFESSVEEVFNYIDANKAEKTKVIVITPTNRTLDAGTYNPLPLSWYRNCLTELALKHGYSVIDGSTIGFANKVGSYQNLTMLDGLHPTDLGYKIYANHILGLLS